MTRVKVLESRDYRGIGLMNAGDVRDLPDDLARQFISQGLVIEYREQVETHPARGYLSGPGRRVDNGDDVL